MNNPRFLVLTLSTLKQTGGVMPSDFSIFLLVYLGFYREKKANHRNGCIFLLGKFGPNWIVSILYNRIIFKWWKNPMFVKRNHEDNAWSSLPPSVQSFSLPCTQRWKITFLSLFAGEMNCLTILPLLPSRPWPTHSRLSLRWGHLSISSFGQWDKETSRPPER